MNAQFLGFLRTVLLSMFLWLLLGSVQGQVVLSPVSAVTTNIGTYNEMVSVTNMVNQSGVETPFVSGTTLFASYFANPAQVFATSGDGGTNNWQSEVSFSLPLQGHIDFDLGGVYQLDKIAIWNRSLRDITVKVFSDLNGPEQVAGSFRLIDRQAFQFSFAVDVLAFATNCQGRYVRLVVDSVHPIFPGATFGYATVGEVALSASPIAPALPQVSVSPQQGGGVLVNFTGTLMTSTNAGTNYVDVPGNPRNTYAIPGANLRDRQFFRARGD